MRANTDILQHKAGDQRSKHVESVETHVRFAKGGFVPSLVRSGCWFVKEERLKMRAGQARVLRDF